NAGREVKEVDEPGGRVTSLSYWGNGVIQNIVDPTKKFQTSFALDNQGRVSQITAPNSNASQYVYDRIGKIKSRTWTNASGQQGSIASYSYSLDNRISSVTSAGTSAISYQYDPAYPRLVKWAQQNGAETYTYYPVTSPPTLGANQVHTVATVGI